MDSIRKELLVRKELRRILDYIREDERGSYEDEPRSGHIYKSIEIVDEWLERTKR
jgi:hypothetical protein